MIFEWILQVAAHNLVDGIAATVTGANGDFHGYTEFTMPTCLTTLINLSEKRKIEIFKDMFVEQLAILCAAHPSLIDSCVHCFKSYRNAEYSVLYFKESDLKLRTFLLVFKYFGPVMQRLSVFSEQIIVQDSGTGAWLLELMTKHCGEKLKSVTLKHIEINYKWSSPDRVSKMKIRNLLVNLRELNFMGLTLINSAFIFELCADTIESLTVMYTKMDESTQSAFIQHYPNLTELQLYVEDNTCITMQPPDTNKFLSLNSQVKTLTLGKGIDYEVLDGYRIESLSLEYVKCSLKLDRLPNLNCLKFFTAHEHFEIMQCWGDAAFMNGLKMSHNLHTIAFQAYYAAPFLILRSIIKNITFKFPNIRVLIFQNVYLRNIDASVLPNAYRTIFKKISVEFNPDHFPRVKPMHLQSFQIDLVECRKVYMTKNNNWSDLDQLFTESNADKTFKIIQVKRDSESMPAPKCKHPFLRHFQ